MDIAIDFRSGDLILAPNRDFAGISGLDEMAQRIHLRLMIERGTWLYDPTEGQLGSRLSSLPGMNQSRAIGEAGLLIREALAPMEDIEIEQVDVMLDPEDETVIICNISYRDITNPFETEIDTTTTVTLPLART